MPVVVKLGSSIVAEDSRRAAPVRRSRASARRSPSCTRAGTDVVVVTSGAIARGMHAARPAGAPDGDRPAPGGLRGRARAAVPHLRRAAGRARRADRAGAAHVLRHERAHALPQRAPDAAGAAGLADRPGDQRERHDHDGRDLLRRQRLPRRAGGGPAQAPTCSSCSPAPRACFTADPRRDPGAALVREVTDFEALASGIGHSVSPLGSGGMRSKVVAAEMATAAGIETVIASGFEPRARCGARWPGERGRARASRRAALGISSLQAVAASTPSRPTDGSRSTPAPRGRCARAARRCCRSASRRRRAAASTRGTRSRSWADERAHRQGDLQLLGGRARARARHEVRRRCARCCRGRPRRPCTATTSCSTEPFDPLRHGRRRHPVRRRDLRRRRARPRRDARAASTRTPRTRRCTRSPTRWSRAREEIVERQRARPRGGPRERACRPR